MMEWKQHLMNRSTGAGEAPGQPAPVSDVRLARAAKSAGANDRPYLASERGVGIHGKASHRAIAEEGGPKN